MATTHPVPAPARVLSSYQVRYRQKSWTPLLGEGTLDPTYPSGLQDATDIHLHAMGPRVDVFGLAKRASVAGMRSVVFKSINRDLSMAI